MKGKENLRKAKEISQKINDYPPTLSVKKREELYRKYFELLRKSAYSGNPEGQYEYAQQFESMTFMSIDNPFFYPKKCIYWYMKSALGGYAEAYNNLADFYERGIGVKIDLNKAYDFYKKASKLGSSLGKKNLKIFEKDIEKGKYSLNFK